MKRDTLSIGSVVRSRLLRSEPFWGSLLMNVRLVESTAVDTLAINNIELVYNPEYLKTLCPPEQDAAFAHECGHLMLGHIWRRRFREHRAWNYACDLALNPLLEESGFILPPDVLNDPQYKGMSAEQIYSKRAEDRQKQEEAEAQSGSDDASGAGESSLGSDQAGESTQVAAGSTQVAEDGSTQADAGSNPIDGQADQSEGQEAEGGSQGAGKQSEAATGAPGAGKGQSTGPWNPCPGCPTGGFSDPVEAEEGEGAEQAMSEQDWQIAVEQAVKVAQAAGKLPGSVAAAVIQARQPRVDWVAELREFVQRNTPSNYSWTSPNRRYAARGLYLPGVVKENIGEMVLAIDTSGSTMWLQKRFADEFSGILLEARPEKVHVVYCDYDVQDTAEVEPDGFGIDYKPKGFGGTRFQPVFDWVEQKGIEPTVLIYLTDGYGDSPKEPGYPVVWAMPEHAPSQGFGAEVRIPVEG